MRHRPIIDAGPALTFFAANQERLLTEVLGALSTPETVHAEVRRKARVDRRFRPAQSVMARLTPRWLEVLSDDVTDELNAVMERIVRLPLVERNKHAEDLGEIMVIAHAVVAAEARADVIVLIDETDGARIAIRGEATSRTAASRGQRRRVDHHRQRRHRPRQGSPQQASP